MNYSTNTYLSTIIDEVFFPTDQVYSNGTGMNTVSNWYVTTPNYTVYDPFIKQTFWDEILKKDFNFKSIETPKYPKSSCHISEDGSVILEMAVTGFDKKDISVKREGEKIIIKGERKKDESEIKLKEIWNDISKKKFETIFTFNDKMNLDKIDVKMNNGLLEVTIPLKEENKPIITELEIK